MVTRTRLFCDIFLRKARRFVGARHPRSSTHCHGVLRRVCVAWSHSRGSHPRTARGPHCHVRRNPPTPPLTTRPSGSTASAIT